MDKITLIEENKEQVADKKHSKIEIQDYLSIGYVILLILGVFHQTIYYKFLGVNILEYSSVLDVLISPISVIAGNLIMGVAIIFAVIVAIIYGKFLPKYHKNLAKKPKYQSGKNKEKIDKIIAQFESSNFSLFMMILMVFSVFIGLGVGSGVKIKKLINKEELELTHEILFEDGTKQKIKKIGKNSLYVFYVTKAKDEVSISPIDGNIKVIKKLKKEN